MARFHTLPRCPLAVQFWLLGLDARRGDLTGLGYRKTPMPTGSSAYTLNFINRHSLTLHSTGLTLSLPEGELNYERRTGRFTLDNPTLGAQLIVPARGRELARPFLHHHEAQILCTHGPNWREFQLRLYALPAPIRRTLPHWQAYMQGLEAQTWRSEQV
ncbi:hypothetical protein [Deinococcus sp. QL22]|uniref:hypothetical protein n=1 Tax=Deinococcus sp. QL22 TaxID=2939437 RepID=UPI00201838B2|nr:hypothetical protein [Deinococcus sp. QL22]UQN05090.1 hypothetical protein M1R55_09255 [Deinococcus sp. QL22]